jgi:hypothetical protein
MFSNPVKFDVECLIGHVGRNESGRKVVNKFLREPGENIDWRDIEDLGLTNSWGQRILESRCVVTNEFRRMTPIRMGR